MKAIDNLLYLVTNDKEEKDFLNIIEEAIKGGVNLVQIREKSSTTKDFYNLALKVKKITRKYDVPLIINDRIDIAIAIDASGVHIGQDDMPCNIARKIIGEDKILGVSASTVSEAIKAEKDGADYIGSGAIFKTMSKNDAPKISKNDLKKIVKSVSIPVVYIGGITTNNIKELDNTGVKGIAIVSAIMDSENPKIIAMNLKKEFEKIN